MNNLKYLQDNICFHDSSVDSFFIDEKSKTLRMEITLMLWAQEGYTDDMPDTEIMTLIFKNVKINSFLKYPRSGESEKANGLVCNGDDTIKTGEIVAQEGGQAQVKFFIANDRSDVCFFLEFYTDDVDIEEKEDPRQY